MVGHTLILHRAKYLKNNHTHFFENIFVNAKDICNVKNNMNVPTAIVGCV